jgi:hypothetical protein
MKPGRNDAGVVPGPIELIEESIHLLREAPKGMLAAYFAGTALFVLGFLFFWAYVTWFTPPPAMIAWSACGLTLLFAAMKTAQADFCQRLMAIRLNAPAPPCSPGRLARLAGGQLRIHAWGLFLLPIATAVMIPFGWVYAYYQNASVLGGDDDAHRLATEQAKIWPAQNHLGLLLIFVLYLAALLNIAGVFLMVPWFMNKILGIDSAFGISGWGFTNTTFFASVFCLSWLATDPVVKAFYVLRVFYGRARSTGEDLRVELQKARAAPGLSRLVAVVVILCACSGGAPTSRCAEVPAARAAVSPEKLDASIDDVMAGRDFQWRLRQPISAQDREADGPIKGFVRKGFEIVRAMAGSLSRLWRRIGRWFDDFFPSNTPAKGETAPGSAGTPALRLLLYIFAGAIVVFAGVVVYLVATRGKAERRPTIAAKEITPAQPDLDDESSHAGQLGTEEWVELARTKLALGEWRLGLRALYLATLARLAADGLVSLAKSKTNLDYEREVRRRSLGRREVPELFALRRATFEDVWYGQLTPDESMARAWLSEMEGPRSR